MAASRSQFLSGSDSRSEELTSIPTAVPVRQPLNPYIQEAGFGTRHVPFHPAQPAFPENEDSETRNRPGHASTRNLNGSPLFPASQSFNRSAALQTYVAASPGNGVQDGSMYFPDNVLESSFAFALCRGNGIYTRLIPADRLPPMRNLPQTQGPEGLIVLPTPRISSPTNRCDPLSDDKFQAAPSAIGDGRPLPRNLRVSIDPIQNRIDSIVTTAPLAPPKKTKIYCDKWLHDGTCAFTQQGCRYKHEMPMDRVTQREVGLFNGLPMWYRRSQAMELQANAIARPSPIVGAGSDNGMRDVNGGVRQNGKFDNNSNWRIWQGGAETPRQSFTSPGPPRGYAGPVGSPNVPTAQGRYKGWGGILGSSPPTFKPRIGRIGGIGGGYESQIVPPAANNIAQNASRNQYGLLYEYGGEDER